MTDLHEYMARLMATQMQADIDAAIRGAYGPTGRGHFNPMGGTFIANDHERPPITYAKIRESIQRVERELSPRPPPLKIEESTLATKDGGPARTYPKRKAKSVSHWRRMNKKWLKRYGIKRVPCMYKLDTSYMTGKPGITLLVHPTIAPRLYAAIARKYS